MWRFLFDPRGTISRSQFAIAGTALAATKIPGDFAIAGMFHRGWNVQEYFFSHVAFLFENSPGIWKFDTALLIWTAPFAWIGLCLLTKRLRSARAPIPLVILFFVPIAKFFLFALLCALPERGEKTISRQSPPALRSWAPESAFGSAGLAVLCATLVGAVLTLLAIKQTGRYTAWLFLGLPFFMGFLASWIHGLARPRRFIESLAAAYLTLAITGAILVSIAAEGIICLGMAAPIALCEATLGAWIGHALRRPPLNGGGSQPVIVASVTLPLLILVESIFPGRLVEFSVTSQLSIKAPPEVVWRHVVSFHQLPPPTEWLFRLGVAYPQRAEIDGQGVGAIRHCIFSTGEFLEPIIVWDEPNRLRFNVTAQPDPLSELSPYRNLQTPHLHGYFNSHSGEFRLYRTDTGTVLLGTTWYSNLMEPQIYWKFWSDALIHRIHLRVLQQIKTEAESEVSTFDSAVFGDDCFVSK